MVESGCAASPVFCSCCSIDDAADDPCRSPSSRLGWLSLGGALFVLMVWLSDSALENYTHWCNQFVRVWSGESCSLTLRNVGWLFSKRFRCLPLCIAVDSYYFQKCFLHQYKKGAKKIRLENWAYIGIKAWPRERWQTTRGTGGSLQLRQTVSKDPVIEHY